MVRFSKRLGHHLLIASTAIYRVEQEKGFDRGKKENEFAKALPSCLQTQTAETDLPTLYLSSQAARIARILVCSMSAVLFCTIYRSSRPGLLPSRAPLTLTLFSLARASGVMALFCRAKHRSTRSERKIENIQSGRVTASTLVSLHVRVLRGLSSPAQTYLLEYRLALRLVLGRLRRGSPGPAGRPRSHRESLGNLGRRHFRPALRARGWSPC